MLLRLLVNISQPFWATRAEPSPNKDSSEYCEVSFVLYSRISSRSLVSFAGNGIYPLDLRSNFKVFNLWVVAVAFQGGTVAEMLVD